MILFSLIVVIGAAAIFCSRGHIKAKHLRDAEARETALRRLAQHTGE